MSTQNLCCTICSETYKGSDEILATKCGHVFHVFCFQNWRARSNTCPECREWNTQSQRIYLHIEESSKTDLNVLATEIELVNKISVLEQQLKENEKNFFDVQHALSNSEEQIKELKQQIELKNVENNSFSQELMQTRQALKESEQNFMSLLKREDKTNEMIAQYAESNIKSKELCVMLENKLKISNNQILQLSKDMDMLKIENQNQRIDMNFSYFENNDAFHKEKLKRLENELKHMSLELDKESKLSTNLTMENMKLKNILSLPLATIEDKQKVAVKYDELRNNVP